MGILVTKIQSYSLHDGPGVRTTVFLKGCSLHCPWCANPETQLACNELWFDESLCLGSSSSCPFSPDCSKEKAKSRTSFVSCPMGALKSVALVYSCKELEEKLLADSPFWGPNGGVTFSGGEPLLQIKELETLLSSLKEKNIDIRFETALNVNKESVAIMLRYASGVYCDIKSLIAEDLASLGGDLAVYKQNLSLLDSSSVPYIIRIPLIKPYTYNPDNIKAISSALADLQPQHVEIFACHDLAAKKYSMLGRELTSCSNVSFSELNSAAAEFKKSGIQVKILNLN